MLTADEARKIALDEDKEISKLLEFRKRQAYA